MIAKLDLSGRWGFCLDEEKEGLDLEFFHKKFQDNIVLPTTVSEAKKGTPSNDENTYFLTDPYLFHGYTWYSREVEFPDHNGKEFVLVLERTRISHVWVDETYVGTMDSLCTSHRYRLTGHISKKKHKLTIMVDNTSYPVKGGHMTSQDTQTNWNGITGGIYIEVTHSVYLTEVKITSNIEKRIVHVKAQLKGAAKCNALIQVVDQAEGKVYQTMEHELTEGPNSFSYNLDETAKLWSEHSPYIYTLRIELIHEHLQQASESKSGVPLDNDYDYVIMTNSAPDLYLYPFGLRSFKAAGKYFKINGMRTFLRGKHDGLIFPMTGYAPTDLKSWLDVFTIAKNYGINHYRFHTCCPPEAAFTAADMLGIYLEPELPFWGTVTDETYENHEEEGQQYLIREGFRILNEFGNHPSFVMMSLGNELWGSKERLDEILGKYRSYDSRHLYTQGSNNFQFVPCILDNEDFFCGVRFSRDRLFRGSYAMCDAPQGHIQTKAPDMNHNYNDSIRPKNTSIPSVTEGGDVTIQYGTGTRIVKAQAGEEMIPQLPVVSHEIGQYAMYPDYSEIDHYNGVLKPYNLIAFRDRILQKGMLDQADRFFRASGRFAAECYKAELETALRSSELAGFQVLDLQDFTGQGTALVGILNSFLENKGLISEEEWREFCSDTVLLAEFGKLVFQAGESIRIGIRLAHFHPLPIRQPRCKVTLSYYDMILYSEELGCVDDYYSGVHHLGELQMELPKLKTPRKLILTISISGTAITNHYDMWVYPVCSKLEILRDTAVVTGVLTEAMGGLKRGNKVLFFPEGLTEANSIEGTYCTDFWCYPMFRSISESMNKPVPVGTLGLAIESKHPVFESFPTENYTTPQWYDIVSNSRSVILDATELTPIVSTIDNFERNHRLGLLFEAKVGDGRLLVCGSDLRKQSDSLSAQWLLESMINYVNSELFQPENQLEPNKLLEIFNPQ